MPKKDLTKTTPDAHDEMSQHPDNPALHTGMESGEIPAEVILGQAGENEKTPALHTGFEEGVDEPGTADLSPEGGQKSPALHTGIESQETQAAGPSLQTGEQENTPISHTGIETAPQQEKKTRRRKTNSQSGESDKKLDQSNESDQTQSQSGTGGKKPVNPAPARRRRRQNIERVLSIDDERTVETREDRLRNDLIDLAESKKGKRILSGTVQGVERSADNPNLSFAVIYHGEIKVIIPAEEMVKPPEDLRNLTLGEVMHYLINKRLGAEVDYIIKGVDPKSGIAAASRLEAMALKRRKYYFGTDRDGSNLIYEGLSAEARVVSVIRAGIFIDLFGLETYIPQVELSYQRLIDAAAHFQPGQRVLVKIIRLDRSDRDNIRVSASVKQAGENPYEKALRKYIPGNRYVGTVSLVDTNGVFVSLEGGVDCLCTYPPRGRPPRGASVTVRIIGVDHNKNRIWGSITHMSTAR